MHVISLPTSIHFVPVSARLVPTVAAKASCSLCICLSESKPMAAGTDVVSHPHRTITEKADLKKVTVSV